MNVAFVPGAGDATASPSIAVASHFTFKADTSINPNKKAGEGLTLQIGDTAEDFNQLTVSIDSMSSKSLGISGIDISSQSGAAAAVDKIKTAINTVSSTRGDSSAFQNRLEHTINNLSVTTENMTAAESRIRDVDMADEMMAYTKNNILVHASQAMPAQANQLPQGVFSYCSKSSEFINQLKRLIAITVTTALKEKNSSGAKFCSPCGKPMAEIIRPDGIHAF